MKPSKYIILTIAIFSFVLLSSINKTLANEGNGKNPIYATFEYVNTQLGSIRNTLAVFVATSGVAEDPNAPQLGDIKYLGNQYEINFWFTPTTNISSYQAGHFYHLTYKLSPDIFTHRIKDGVIIRYLGGKVFALVVDDHISAQSGE